MSEEYQPKFTFETQFYADLPDTIEHQRFDEALQLIRERNEGNQEKTDAVIEYIRARLHSGKLAGRLAIDIYDRWSAASHRVTAPLWHGSPHRLRALYPRQPYWQDEAGGLYMDGRPCICASDKPEMPLMRSLLHREQPALQESQTLLLILRKDKYKRPYYFTSRQVIEQLTEGDAVGYVYALQKHQYSPDHWDEFQNRYFDMLLGTRDEYRLHHDIQPDKAIKVQVPDLPPELLILDGSLDDCFDILAKLPSSTIKEIRNQPDVKITPAGGTWPLGMHPTLNDE